MNNSEILELAHHKLIILYIIKGANHFLTDEELSRFILEQDLINYFYLNQYIKEMLEQNLIDKDENNQFFLTKYGDMTLDMFINKLPEELLSQIVETLKEFKKKKITEQSIVAEYSKDNFGKYICTLAIKEYFQDIISLKIEAPDEELAKTICKNFKERPEDYYLKITNLLIN